MSINFKISLSFHSIDRQLSVDDDNDVVVYVFNHFPLLSRSFFLSLMYIVDHVASPVPMTDSLLCHHRPQKINRVAGFVAN